MDTRALRHTEVTASPTYLQRINFSRGKAVRIEVQKWGNSAAVRIPAPALKDAGMRVGQSLELRVEGGKLIVEPATESLDDLLARMPPENPHALALEGPAAGVEAW